jgi:hypothetical protein
VSGDSTQLTLTVPAHSVGSIGVTVTNPGGHSAASTLTYLPVVASLGPASGATTGGGSVTITGAGFVPGSTSVLFGTIPTPVTNVTASTVTVTVPAHAAGAVDVSVTVSGVSATKAGAYTYGTTTTLPTPKPPVGGSGNPVTLPGSRPAGPSSQSGSPNPLPTGR